MKLLVISHTPHYLSHNQIVGWGPTVIELSHLAGLFDELVHVAPLSKDVAPASSLPYSSERVRLKAVAPAGGDNLIGKLGVLCRAPAYLHAISSELRSADVVHVRCPASISLVALVMLAIAKKPVMRWFKYAGNWQPTNPQPLSYRVQRWWLVKNLAHGVVTVNGDWPGQPNHVIPFNNPCISAQELAQAAGRAAEKQLAPPLRLLFIGRLDHGKGADKVVQICHILKRQGCDFTCDIIGDGYLRTALAGQIASAGLQEYVQFHGWLPKPRLSHFYQNAQFILLPSTSSEGWPKVLAEAMAYGVVPLASAISSIPQVLAHSGAGAVFDPHDVQAFAQAILDFAGEPGLWKQASCAGVSFAHHFTYETYLERVRQLLAAQWQPKENLNTTPMNHHEQ